MNKKISKQHCILIVEDDEELRLIFKILITHHTGYSILEADNGEQAVHLATENQPSLILMDLKLPKMSGLEAIELLHATPSTTHIPIVVVSDHCWQKDVQEIAYDYGVVQCTDKSNFLEQLPIIINECLVPNSKGASHH